MMRRVVDEPELAQRVAVGEALRGGGVEAEVGHEDVARGDPERVAQ